MPELLAIGCFLILPWVGIATALQHEYRTAEVAAVRATGNLAQALEESTRRTIGQIDYILLSARVLQAAQGDRFNFHEWTRTQTFADKMTAQIAMADRTGLVTASTLPLAPGVSIADRRHFQVQTDPAHDDLFISRPVIGRISGLETIQFSRRMPGADGAFGGVVVLSLGCSELARFYESLGLGQGFVSIVSTEGIILARGPFVAGATGAHISAIAQVGGMLERPFGSVRLPANAFHGAQIVSFRRLEDYPIIVTIGINTEAAFAAYRSLRGNVLLGGTAVTLAVGLIGLLWVRQKRRSLASYRALSVTLDTISQGILMVDGHGEVSVINPRVLDLLAWPDERPEAAMKHVVARATELIPATANDGAGARAGRPESGARRDSRLETTLENGTILEVRTHALGGGGFVQTYTDVTEQRTALAQVEHLAHHDALTGLENRVALRQLLTATIDHGDGRNEVTALILIDLDGFKAVNDTRGHDAGDQLLIELARSLKSLVRGTDAVARLGGDEFAILALGLHRCEDVGPLAERVLRRLSEPAQIQGQPVRVGASLGIAFHPQDGLDVDTLFKCADMALYSAKTGGRGMYRCFDEQLTQVVTEQRLLESELRRALDDDALEVYYQPKFDARSLEITGFEALARWRHPTRGTISPEIFIRLAEHCGLINRLGQWVLERACRSVAAWQPRLPVAVNVSVMQLRDSGLKDAIAAVLEQTGLAAEHLEIEVTESVLAHDDQIVLANLQAIKALGIRIALDDFGTGYSSLSYLRRFPFDKIKIDRAFVQGQAEDPGVRVILEAILDMCHNLGLATVGEGVETPEQLALLRDRGCTEIQGYLLGRPMPADQIQAFIRSHLPARGGQAAQDAEPKEVAILS